MVRCMHLSCVTVLYAQLFYDGEIKVYNIVIFYKYTYFIPNKISSDCVCKLSW